VTGSIVERIWAYDASLWTNAGEDRWLGWLDVVDRVGAGLVGVGVAGQRRTVRGRVTRGVAPQRHRPAQRTPQE
jgi:hypothetical protein